MSVYHIIAHKIVNILVGKNDVLEEQKNIWVYGTEILLQSFVTAISVLIVGGIFNQLIGTIVFLILFCLIRQNAGGYHAESVLGCYIFFMLSYFVILFLVYMFGIDWQLNKTGIFIFVLLNIIIMLLAPVDTKNKRLEPDEKLYYRSRSYVFLFIEIVLYVLLIKVKLYSLAVWIYYVVSLESVFLILQFIKDKGDNK